MRGGIVLDTSSHCFMENLWGMLRERPYRDLLMLSM